MRNVVAIGSICLLLLGGCENRKNEVTQSPVTESESPRQESRVSWVDAPLDLEGEWNQSFEANGIEAKRFLGRLMDAGFQNSSNEPLVPALDFPRFGDAATFSLMSGDVYYEAKVQWSYHEDEPVGSFAITAIVDDSPDGMAAKLDPEILNLAFPSFSLPPEQKPGLAIESMSWLSDEAGGDGVMQYWAEPTIVSRSDGIYEFRCEARSRRIDDEPRISVLLEVTFTTMLDARRGRGSQ